MHVYVVFKPFMLFEVWLTSMCVCCEADREREREKGGEMYERNCEQAERNVWGLSVTTMQCLASRV